MAYIKVDHSEFEKAASVIDSYVTKHRNNMNSINSAMNALASSWQGNDYQQVKAEWQEINAYDSTSGKMIRTMQSYADFLRFAAKKYKDAQSNAVNRANRLPKY